MMQGTLDFGGQSVVPTGRTIRSFGRDHLEYIVTRADGQSYRIGLHESERERELGRYRERGYRVGEKE